jgi:methionyl aminopeptidase
MAVAQSTRIELKSPREIDLLRAAGRLSAKILFQLKAAVEPGMTTRDVDAMSAKLIRENGAVSSFMNYRGYPATICTSVNEEIVHGIPGPRKLKEGDLLSLDIGMFLEGYCGDTATSFIVGGGTGTPEAERLMKAGRDSLASSIAAAKFNGRLGDVCYAMQKPVEDAGYTVVREYGGHGIGRAMHEEPHVPCFGKPGTGMRLTEGLVLALEVMANAGTADIVHKSDGWTVVTADKKLSVHYEKMVAITAQGTEILTPHGDEGSL